MNGALEYDSKKKMEHVSVVEGNFICMLYYVGMCILHASSFCVVYECIRVQEHCMLGEPSETFKSWYFTQNKTIIFHRGHLMDENFGI